MSYTTAEVSKLTGASFRQLDHWARKKWIDLGDDPGIGTARSWSRRNMLTAKMVMNLISAGFSTDQAFKIANLVMESVMTHITPTNLQIRLAKGIRVSISTHEALGLASHPVAQVDTVEREIA